MVNIYIIHPKIFPIYITQFCTDTIDRYVAFDVYKILPVLLYTPIYMYSSEFY